MVTWLQVLKRVPISALVLELLSDNAIQYLASYGYHQLGQKQKYMDHSPEWNTHDENQTCGLTDAK